jgi:hypothetical protein
MAVLAGRSPTVGVESLQVLVGKSGIAIMAQGTLETAHDARAGSIRRSRNWGMSMGNRKQFESSGTVRVAIGSCATARIPTPPSRRFLRPARRMATLLVLAVIVVGLAPRALARSADTDQSDSVHNAKGYDRNSAYLNIDGPDVDAFNFNFVTQFALGVGMTYPENAGVSLKLNLTYNSRVSNWQKRTLERKGFRIRRQNPYGLGFDVNLGKIINTTGKFGAPSAVMAYVDSSGASHRLAQVATSPEYRTRDGSHIRAVLSSDGACQRL